VPIEGVGLVGGRARGAVHLVDDPLAWMPGDASGPQVLALPGLWWPPPEGVPDAPVAFLLQGAPGQGGATTLAPVIAGIDLDLLREGERVEVDGRSGSVKVEGLSEAPVVTVFLERKDGRVLLLKRSGRVGSFRGRWAGVSGFLEDPTPLAQALREVREETRLEATDLEVVEEGRPVYARDADRLYIVHPFRVRTRRTRVTLDWEHTESEWVDPAEIRRRPTVPKLDRAWDHVRPSDGAKG